MRKQVCLVITLAILNCCKAQQGHLDSLINLLNNHTKEDTVKLNLLNDIVFDYSSVDPTKGLLTADTAIALAKKLGHKSKLATAYNYKAINYGSEGEDTMALKYYKLALALHQQTGNILRIGTTYNNIAISLVNLSNYPAALEYHLKALGIFERLGDKMRMGNSLNNIGVIYLYLADYDKALEYYLKALTVIEQTGNKGATGNTFTNIGLVYDHLLNFTKALEYHTKALDIYKSTGDKLNEANALGNMGNVYHDMDSSDKALALYGQALALSQQIGNRRGIASNYANIGIVYSSLGNYAKAMEYLQKSLTLNTQAQDKQRMAGDYNQLGKLYLQAPASFLTEHGITVISRYNKVVEYANRALALATEIGSPDVQRDAWETLEKAYELQHDNAKALEAYKNFIIFRDSVIDAETKQNITRKEMQFDFDKKEALEKAENDKQKAIAADELKRQRIVKNTTGIGAAVILIAALSSFIFYKKRRDAVELQKEAEFKTEVTDTEMKALRAQMNPHFIFNSLNSISDYIQRADTETATTYTVKFAKLMRMILENSEHKEVALADDLQALELYIQLERLRMNDKFNYAIIIDETIDLQNTFIPPLLLQPFVENSIWHGIAKKQGTGKIIIRVMKETNMLAFVVEDDGVGRPAFVKEGGKKTGSKSLGIKITQSRIDILNKIKKSNAEVKLTDLVEGTRVEVRLPFETDI